MGVLGNLRTALYFFALWLVARAFSAAGLSGLTDLCQYTLFSLCPLLIEVQHARSQEKATIASDLEASKEDENTKPGVEDAIIGLSAAGKVGVHGSKVEGRAAIRQRALLLNDRAPVDASLHKLLGRLISVDGMRGLFRGFFLTRLIFIPVTITAGATVLITHIFAILRPFVFYSPMSIFTVHFDVAWNHYAVSRTSKSSIVAWLPPFWKTIRATWKIEVLNAVVSNMSLAIVWQSVKALDLETFGNERNWNMLWESALTGAPPYNANSQLYTKVFMVFVLKHFVDLASGMILGPLLTRVYVSLLPEDDITIVPIDRSFGVPAAKRRGYITIAEAWQSISWDTWYNLVKVYLQATVVYACFCGVGLFAIYLYYPAGAVFRFLIWHYSEQAHMMFAPLEGLPEAFIPH